VSEYYPARIAAIVSGKGYRKDHAIGNGHHKNRIETETMFGAGNTNPLEKKFEPAEL